MDTSLVLDVHTLTKGYRKRNGTDVIAVDHVSFSVEEGEIFGLLGHNGAGKTTTIKMICGLVKPSSGTVCINGMHLSQQHTQTMRSIGAVLEGTRNVYWTMTVWQNLTYFARLKGFATQDMHTRGEQLLRELHLWERRHERVGTFSRGMQQKVAIACALINDPMLILLDEPTLGLDVDASRTVRNWITKLAKEHNKAILVTSHELGMVQATCDRVGMMRSGKLVVDQPIQTLLENVAEEMYEIRLDIPCPALALPGWHTTVHENQTILTGKIQSPVELQCVLDELYEMGMYWCSVNRVQLSLEDVFINFMGSDEEIKPNDDDTASNI